MTALDIILNCAALLLWLNWWSRGVSVPRAGGIALISTLRRAEPAQRDRWVSPAAIAAILFIRAILYWQIGQAIKWSPRLSLVAITLPFRSDNFPRMFLFSILSFIVFVAAFYFCALLMSAVNRSVPATDPWQAFIRVLLGPVDRWPAWGQALLPFAAGVLFWLLVGPLLSAIGVQVPVKTFSHRLEEAVLIGLGSYASWKYVIIAVLALHALVSYVYLGAAPLWQFVGFSARNLLRPMGALQLRAGRIDFAPLLAIAIVAAGSELIERWLPKLYVRLPI